MVSRNNAAMRYRALSLSCVRTLGCTYKRLNRSPGIPLTPSIPPQEGLVGTNLTTVSSRTYWASSLDKVGQDIALTFVPDSLVCGDPDWGPSVSAVPTPDRFCCAPR